MSALAVRNIRFSELEVLRAIGRITWSSHSEELALAAIESAITRLRGVTGLVFERELGSPQDTRSAFALAPVVANGLSYGFIRIFFDPYASDDLESPVRLAKYIGQQIGLLLHRIALQRERQNHYARLNTLNRNLRRRKVLHRAAVLLAEQRHISHPEAISFMVQYARRNRRPLLEVCESLMFGYDSQRVGSKSSKVSQFHVR